MGGGDVQPNAILPDKNVMQTHRAECHICISVNLSVHLPNLPVLTFSASFLVAVVATVPSFLPSPAG
jgi:hypothetical protein